MHKAGDVEFYDNPLEELIEDCYEQWEWTDWEEEFIASVEDLTWAQLSNKQKDKVSELVKKVRNHMNR